MMARDVVEDEVITKLWQVYSVSPSPHLPFLQLTPLIFLAGTAKDIPRFQRRGAIIVLGMFAQTKPEVVADHVETLLKIGLGPLGRVRSSRLLLSLFREDNADYPLLLRFRLQADLVLAKYTCIALGRVGGSVKKVKGASALLSICHSSLTLPCPQALSATFRSASRWTVPCSRGCLRLSKLPPRRRNGLSFFFLSTLPPLLTPSRLPCRFSLAEQALNTVYTLGDQPDALCSDILRKMSTRVFAPKPAADAALTVEKEEEADESMTEPIEAAENEDDAAKPIDVGESGASKDDDPLGNAFELSQLIFVAGHCSVKQLVHLELVERDLKRRKAEDDKAKLALAGGKGKNAGDDELDQVAGSVEDEIGDAIHAAKETELLEGPESLLAIFGPMAAEIVAKPKVYKVRAPPLTSPHLSRLTSPRTQNSMLQTAATLALSKFMCISSKFCDAHLNLLFKVLETSREPAVRSNIVIALGDIAVSFSTIMDEKSDELYAGLHDKDATVKKNTLMVLTHLILNGMIKVKGQLGEMAKCLSDEDKRIKDLAHLFFEELATKDKAIYNNLPDIISHLSTGHNPVEEDTFQTSMKFIFKFVDKVRPPSFFSPICLN